MSGVIATRILSAEDMTPDFLARWDKLAEASGSGLPFHRHPLPLSWWTQFNGVDGTAFPEKRGRNYFGSNSRVTAFHLFVAERDGQLAGLVPLVAATAKVGGFQGEMRILSFCGDSVLAAFQDFLALPDGRPLIVSALFAAILAKARADQDLLFLGYFPERSPNLPILKEMLASARADGWEAGSAQNQRKGGVHPWSLGILGYGVRKLGEKAPETADPALKAKLIAAADKLDATTAGALFFAGTRIGLENQIKALLEEAKTAGLEGDIQGLLDQLVPAAIDYPRLALAKTREAYLAGFSKETRRYFKRYKTRFEEAGGSFERLEPEAVTPADVDEYLGLHTQRFGDDSVAVNGGTLAFHKDVAMHLAKQGLFRLFFAKHEGRRIASHSCIDIAGRREGYYNGRDPAQEELRAGKLVYMETILDAIDKGLKEYELGYGGGAYKASFTEDFGRTENLVAYRGGAGITLDKVFTQYERISLGA